MNDAWLHDAVDLTLVGMRRVAVVGLSANPMRESYGVAAALQRAGYQIIPVNPMVDEVLSERAYPDLASVPGRIDVVDVFRRPEQLAEVAREAVAREDVGAVFVQLGLASQEARAIVTGAGRAYVEDRCLRVEVDRRRAAPPRGPRVEHPVVLLDLDDTLLDHDACERAAVGRTLVAFGLPADATTIDTYVRVNAAAWVAYRQGSIDSVTLRTLRWEQTLAALALTGVDVQALSDLYVEEFGRSADVIEGAVEAAWWLARRSRVVVATNGFAEVQTARLAAAGLDTIVHGIASSEEAQAPKPDPALLRLAVSRARRTVPLAVGDVGEVAPSDVVMVGDQLATDIAAGVAYGADTVWIAADDVPLPADRPATPTHRVPTLRELA
jgi:predicted CoA-binding protein/FMN phosphatase YigB (HAD superfamily)